MQTPLSSGDRIAAALAIADESDNEHPQSYGLLNTTMKLKSDTQRYVNLAARAGFQHRHDPPKNWDNFKCVAHILRHHPKRDSIILDAGGTMSGAFLQSLEQFGYKRLVALDLTGPEPPKYAGSVVHRKGDITKTEYPENYFDAVGCLSVIEHGVDLELFFAEMARVIKPNGSLIVSTDYWADKIENPDGRAAYGVPVFLFSAKEIAQLVTIAEKHGFVLTSPVDYECKERTVEWMGFSYTFIVLGFRRKAGG